MEARELKRTHRRVIAVLAALAIAGGVTACGGNDHDGDTIKVGYAFGFDIGDTGDQVAFDRMTAATGIEPEFTETGSGEAAIAALVNGDIDMAKVSFSDTINAIAQGADVCMILPANQTVDLILVSQPEIRTLADLRGRKITLERPGPSLSSTVLQQTLAAEGLSEDDYEIGYLEDSQNRAAALQSGRIEAATLESVDLELARADGAELNTLADPGSRSPSPANSFLVRCDFAEDNPELLNRVAAGLLPGYASLYGPGGREAWVAKAREGDLADQPVEVAKRIYENERAIGYWPRGAPLTEAEFNQAQEFYEANGIAEEPVPFDRAWDLTFWQNAAKEAAQTGSG